jgi:hypothetical protein
MGKAVSAILLMILPYRDGDGKSQQRQSAIAQPFEKSSSVLPRKELCLSNRARCHHKIDVSSSHCGREREKLHLKSEVTGLMAWTGKCTDMELEMTAFVAGKGRKPICGWNERHLKSGNGNVRIVGWNLENCS